MVCQNQSIDDSDAPLAHDLRVLVRERLEAGDSDKQVLDFLVARYGDFVLLKPPVKLDTLLLVGPAAGGADCRARRADCAARRRRKADFQAVGTERGRAKARCQPGRNRRIAPGRERSHGAIWSEQIP